MFRVSIGVLGVSGMPTRRADFEFVGSHEKDINVWFRLWKNRNGCRMKVFQCGAFDLELGLEFLFLIFPYKQLFL